ncbi:MAG: hypothetical protein JWR58_1380 [Pseudonocardia sp.]|nr:hypothetical protein [Pseudonocardia sp.]
MVYAEHRDETDGTEQHDGRQQPGQYPGGDDPLRLRWRFERELAAGHPRRETPRSDNSDRAHARPSCRAAGRPNEFCRTALPAAPVLRC